MDRKEKLNRIFLILLSLFVVMLGYGILLPTLPYYTERLAIKGNLDTDLINFHIGLLTSIYPFFQLLFVVVWGKLSDKYGRKPIIICGLIGFVIMQLLTGLATSLTMLYVARIFGGIFTSAVIPVSNAYLSDITSEKRRTKIMAWSGVAISSGVIFGPVIGGFLSQTDIHIKYSIGLLHLDRFSVPFLFVALLGLIVLFVVMKWLKNTARVHRLMTQKVSLRFTFTKYFIVLLILSFVAQFVVTRFRAAPSRWRRWPLTPGDRCCRTAHRPRPPRCQRTSPPAARPDTLPPRSRSRHPTPNGRTPRARCSSRGCRTDRCAARYRQ